MPMYEYRCRQCGTVTEHLVMSSGEHESLLCSSCDSRDLEKIMSVTNVSTYPSPSGGRTCCGREEQCGNPRGCCGC
jgi:putative FmdB family regulatory protein